MATILVDYENVCMTSGLKGVEYLNEKDTLIIFYSQCCEKIRSEYMEAIEVSGCAFKIRKLVKTGKNALDFYIASECGCVSKSGETQIAIISKDKGFAAVSDYFHTNSEINNVLVVIASDVENALMSLNAPEDVARRMRLKEMAKSLDIAVEHARIQERRAFKSRIFQAFAGTEYEERVDEIWDYMEQSGDCLPRVLYTGALHRFGREDGCEIYRRLRGVI